MCFWEVVMAHVFERDQRVLFATLLESGPRRSLRLRLTDLAGAAVLHLAIIALLVWLTTHSIRPITGIPSDVRSIILPEGAVSLAAEPTEAAHGTAAARAVRRAAHRIGAALAAAPMLPDLTDVINSVARQLQAMVSIDFGDDLVRSVGSDVDTWVARDTTPRIPSVDELAKAVVLTPFTRAPDLLNRGEIAQRLHDRFPPDMIDMAVGGVTNLWLLIDTDGAVRKSQVATSSGMWRLDRLALGIVRFMHFQPAFNRGHPTPIWVQLPVRFQVIDR
jgi:TonB family protein